MEMIGGMVPMGGRGMPFLRPGFVMAMTMTMAMVVIVAACRGRRNLLEGLRSRAGHGHIV